MSRLFYIKCDEVNAWSVWEKGNDEVIVFDLFKSDAQLIRDKLNELSMVNEAVEKDHSRLSNQLKLAYDKINELTREKKELEEKWENTQKTMENMLQLEGCEKSLFSKKRLCQENQRLKIENKQLKNEIKELNELLNLKISERTFALEQELKE